MSDYSCPELVDEAPAHSSFLAHSLAGAVAGMAETAAMYPLDTIKTRMQATTVTQHGKGIAAVRAGNTSLPSMLVHILREEGVRGLYRGLTPATAGAGPAHALYYAVYELTKKELGANRDGHRPFSVAAAGVAATVVNDAVMTPADVVKQRLQVSRSQNASVLKCIVRVWQEGGIAAFYRSYPATLLMNVPWTVLHFPIYESSKKLLAPGREGREGTVVELAAGGLAGGVAAALTTPFDVVKTRLQLGSDSPVPARSAVNAFSIMRQIAHEEGVGALWTGWQPRALWHAPAAAICWTSYEAMKRFLGVNVSHKH